MNLDTYIERNFEVIIAECQARARTILRAPKSPNDLRDRCREILVSIRRELETRVPAHERLSPEIKLDAHSAATDAAPSAGLALSDAASVELLQLLGEFLAVRSSVFDLWHRDAATSSQAPSPDDFERFDDVIDQALTASVERYVRYLTNSRDMFLAVLGHDLRTPLQSINMASALLGVPAMSGPDRLKIATQIVRAAKMMDSLITDVLDFTRGRLGAGIPIERSACDLRCACEEALDIVHAGNPDCNFIHDFSGDLRIDGDRLRLRQMLSNLLNNAVQHGDRRAPIALKATGDPEAVVLSVANSGKAIPTEALSVIFDPLVQAPASTTDLNNRPHSSLGLGLFIAREIALGHGGTIDVESSLDTGTVFTVRLPRSTRGDVALFSANGGRLA